MGLILVMLRTRDTSNIDWMPSEAAASASSFAIGLGTARLKGTLRPSLMVREASK